MTRPTPVTDEDDTLIMTIKLRSGRFESSIEVPLMSSDADKRAFIDSWLTLMAMGLRCTSKEALHDPR